MRSRAELYDWELANLHNRVDQDVAFYRSLAVAMGGPVLELACGTGRITTHLPNVVGLDLDADMLRVARSRGVARVVQADMRRFAFAQRFAVVAIPYNSLQLLPSDEAVVETLRCAAAHLAPSGLLAFEATDFGAERDVEPELLAEADGVALTGWLRVESDAGGGGLLHYHRRFEEAGEVYEDVITLRRAGASRAEDWVRDAGLKLVSADWAGIALRVVARPTP